MSARDDLLAHLAGGVTTLCRAWAVTRRDGVVLGFTDHDADVAMAGMTFKASTGMTARALQQTTGLAVDNSEAAGALSDLAIDEADLAAGRFDGAEVKIWLVNWANPSGHMLQFRGTMGEVTRAGGAFKVELRGQTDRLNQMQGRVFQRFCGAALGDADCGVDLAAPGLAAELTLATIDGRGRLVCAGPAGQVAGWFERGTLTVLDGAAAGLIGTIKTDKPNDTGRVVDLVSGLAAPLAAGDRVRLVAGCDKLAATCREKFANFVNFRGFPHIPGEDWLASYPVRTRSNDGGSLRR